MSSFTPGPWVVEGTGIRALVRAGINGVIVAIRHRLPAREHEANADLIAAAPDLLEAGSNLLEAFKSAFGINETWTDERIYDEMPTSGLALAYFAIHAAISKATGAGHD